MQHVVRSSWMVLELDGVFLTLACTWICGCALYIQHSQGALCCVQQVGNHLFKVHTRKVTLADLPFTPRRDVEWTFHIRDPIGAAITLLLDQRVSGMCIVRHQALSKLLPLAGPSRVAFLWKCGVNTYRCEW